MKTATSLLIALSLVTVLSSAFAEAPGLHESPGRRACRQNQAQQWDVRIGDDQVGFCRIGGLGLDETSYGNRVTVHASSRAIDAFLAQVTPGSGDPASDCQASGGTYLATIDLDGNDALLCSYSDGSMIEAQALSLGSGSAEGSALAQALRR